jgi:hypothetical protein
MIYMFLLTWPHFILSIAFLFLCIVYISLTFNTILCSSGDGRSCKGKSVQQMPDVVKMHNIPMPEGLFECYKNAVIASDNMYLYKMTSFQEIYGLQLQKW